MATAEANFKRNQASRTKQIKSRSEPPTRPSKQVKCSALQTQMQYRTYATLRPAKRSPDATLASIRELTHQKPCNINLTSQTNAVRGKPGCNSKTISIHGCMTCKKKRIKCDEAKPTCGQCEKRKLECDGYKLRYRWLSFDDTHKPPPGAGNAPQKKNPNLNSSSNVSRTITQEDTQSNGDGQLSTPPASFSMDADISWSPSLPSLCAYTAAAASRYLPVAAEDDPIDHLDQLTRPIFDRISDLESGSFDANQDLMLVPPISPSQFSGSYDTISDEEVVRDWAMSTTSEAVSPQLTLQASSPTDSQNSMDPFRPLHMPLFNTICVDHSSPEMLLLRFDTETCSILSIKDGYGENPWRTVVRPLAKDSDALCHAISAMAALHGAATQPRLRIVGMTHMTKAISKLSAEMHSMSENQVLATALSLCISEGWDDRISTGIKHLKGAKPVLVNALTRRSRSIKLGQMTRDEAISLQFLSNTFVYLDTIARLTSSEENGTTNLIDTAIQAMSERNNSEIDPLMGCAATLFPLLGRVASLVQKVRKTTSNSLSVISEANDLREELLNWELPDMYSLEQSQDPNCSVRHVLQTAEAYRRAILLHLHSAVTEVSSEPSYNQAKDTLSMLAGTPLTSRTMIVQIFPLLVGSCEMFLPEDRHWVTQRWAMMMKQLTLVNVSSCWKIVQEVWRRRDLWVETQPRPAQPPMSRSVSSGPLPSQTNHLNLTESNSMTGDSPATGRQGHAIHDCSAQTRLGNRGLDTVGTPPPRCGSVRLPRHHTDVSLLGGGLEYTVRGQLHWLGVMADWNWEVFL